MDNRNNWLITGCSTGFGWALAEAVLAQGGNVLLSARSTGGLETLVRRYPDNAQLIELDVTRQEQIAAAVEKAESEFGGIDVLVNNAGYGAVGAIEETSPEEYRPMFEVNFFGAMEMTRAVLPGMRRRRNGHIVNMSSIAGLTVRAGFGFYGASKFALEGASEALAQEVGPLGIRVTLVEPGPFRTDFAGRSMQHVRAEIDDYADTSGVNRAGIRQRDGNQPGDPVRAAQVILDVVRAERPPLHLPLGSYAYGRLRDKISAISADAQAWEPVAGKPAEYD